MMKRDVVNNSGNLLIRAIVAILIIVLMVCIVINFLSTYISPNITTKKISRYLEKKDYGDEFSSIEFIEMGDYKERVPHWWGDGETSLKKCGTYTRYKVHANNTNIDFYVQYRSDLRDFEDDYVVAKEKKEIFEEISNICNENFGDSLNLHYSTTIVNDEVGVLENTIPNLIADIDEPIDKICSEEFSKKIKTTRDEIYESFLKNKYYKDYEYWFFEFRIVSTNYMIDFDTLYYNNVDDEFNVGIKFYIKGEKNEYNNEYKEKFEKNNQYSNDIDVNAYIVTWDFK